MSGSAWVVPGPRTRPEPVIVVCAYCDRTRDGSGEWRVTASGGRYLLSRWSGVLVSHGCCPDCLDRELARCQRAELPD
ncbi:MAG TPA: hypothetical protein VFT28_05120 [Gemmatimonadales bacterium]|nr:hypothetical protein [Gemmatimonadales bacterium]